MGLGRWGALPRGGGGGGAVGRAAPAGWVLQDPECQVPPGWGRAWEAGKAGECPRPSLGTGLFIPATHPGPLGWRCKPTPPPPAPPQPQTRGVAGFGSASISSPQTSLRDLVPESGKLQSWLPLHQPPAAHRCPLPFGPPGRVQAGFTPAQEEDGAIDRVGTDKEPPACRASIPGCQEPTCHGGAGGRCRGRQE